MEELLSDCRELDSEQFHIPYISSIIKSRRRGAEHVAYK
jgi:hypothetical protein